MASLIPAKLVPLPPITQALCLSCGACCSAVVEGELVACRHLDTRDGFRCRIYADRPQVCRDFACITGGRVSPVLAERVHAAIGAIA